MWLKHPVSHSHGHSLTPSSPAPGASHTASHITAWWITLIHSRPLSHICPCDTHNSPVLTMLQCHTRSLAHIWFLDVTNIPLTVSHAVTYRSSRSPHIHCHTQRLGVTRFHTVTLCFWLSQKISQGHTATHNLWRHARSQVVHTHTVSLLASHTTSRCHPRAATGFCTRHTRAGGARTLPAVLSLQPPAGHTGAPAARRAAHPAGAKAVGGCGNPEDKAPPLSG